MLRSFRGGCPAAVILDGEGSRQAGPNGGACGSLDYARRGGDRLPQRGAAGSRREAWRGVGEIRKDFRTWVRTKEKATIAGGLTP